MVLRELLSVTEFEADCRVVKAKNGSVRALSCVALGQVKAWSCGEVGEQSSHMARGFSCCASA